MKTLNDLQLYNRCYEMFTYVDGYLIRKIKTSSRALVGDSPSNISRDGYRNVSINGVGGYLQHRLIFLMHHKYMPRWPQQVDHADGDKLNNKIENLRDSSPIENANNRGSRGGTSKYKGVCWASRDKKWMAAMIIRGKKSYLGYYHSEDDAARVINLGILMYHGSYSVFNKIPIKGEVR